MLSVRDINDTVEEAYRCAEDLKFKSVFLRSNFGDLKPWHDPYYEPLWDALEKLDLPIGFHESSGSSLVGSNFDPNFGLRRVYGQPVGQMLGLGHFIGGGILARHPKLKVAFLEANCSWLPWLLWRMDEGYEREGDVAMPDLTKAPSEYFREQIWVSVEPDETPARHVIEDLGADNIVFSTDYPHGDSKYPEAVNAFMELPFSDEAKRKILWDNCARLYAIGQPAAV
jgi:predicted TIM-barrel fold metal-dependent hydrolase